ncbi:MAG: hypothetical protein NTV42_10095 [Chloroflexi bacterium]|nr:hypothetical protein [Chloroflexota bacterium]
MMVLMLHAGILSLLPMPAMADDTVVTFPDANLEAAIRVAIGKPSGYIYASDLASLKDIDLSTKGIINLSGLEYCTGLTRLSLNNNQISNLTPLAGLADLLALNLENNQISNLTPLAGLTKLTILNLPRNQISNLTPLAGLADLLALNLGDNRISNLTPLAGLTKLTILNLQNNRISNLTPLAGLADLLALNLEDNQISNLAPLAGLTKLTIINLQNNQISNLTPLVANSGLGVDDAVDLRANPLNKTSVDVHIPALIARGVTVLWDAPAPTPTSEPPNGSSMISTTPHSASMPATVTLSSAPIQLSNIYVQQAVLSTSAVTPDSPLYVTATVANKGSVNGTIAVVLIVNGEEESRQGFSVASGSTIPVTFTVQKSQPGIYNVSVNNTPAGSFTVSDNSMILIISFACVILALILGVILIYRRFTV